jgi:pimeloyl-ACP methyl ester carboxylesterase
VLAGHSFGGLYVRIFAAHYPDEVAGLVLLDSTASAEPAMSVVPSTGDRNISDGADRFATLASLSARVGLTRLVGDLVGGTLPARSEEELRYDTAQASTVRSVIDEYQRGGAAASQAASLRDFGDKPLFVLTAGEHPASWITAQKKMTTLSTNSAHQVVDGATHAGLLTEPQYAPHVTQAVLDVLTSIRDDEPLKADR